MRANRERGEVSRRRPCAAFQETRWCCEGSSGLWVARAPRRYANAAVCPAFLAQVSVDVAAAARQPPARLRPHSDTQAMAAAELVAQLRGAAAEREAAYARLLQLEAEHFNANGGSSGSAAMGEIAVACASPLCEVLCKAVAEVDAAEYHRAAQVLIALSGAEPARVGGECIKPDQCNLFKAWMAPDSALGVGESGHDSATFHCLEPL